MQGLEGGEGLKHQKEKHRDREPGMGPELRQCPSLAPDGVPRWPHPGLLERELGSSLQRPGEAKQTRLGLSCQESSDLRGP